MQGIYNYLTWQESLHLGLEDDDPTRHIAKVYGGLATLYSHLHRITYWHPGWGFGRGPTRTWWETQAIQNAMDEAAHLKIELGWD